MVMSILAGTGHKSSGKPMSQIARELGISDSALSKLCRQISMDRSKTLAILARACSGFLLFYLQRRATRAER